MILKKLRKKRQMPPYQDFKGKNRFNFFYYINYWKSFTLLIQYYFLIIRSNASPRFFKSVSTERQVLKSRRCHKSKSSNQTKTGGGGRLNINSSKLKDKMKLDLSRQEELYLKAPTTRTERRHNVIVHCILVIWKLIKSNSQINR